MDRCTHEMRIEYWKGIIQACGQRAAGQTHKSWLNENGISEQGFYYWQRKFRQKAYTLIKENESVGLIPSKEADVSFVEIPFSANKQENITNNVYSPVAVIRTCAMSIEISNAISEPLLARILKEVSNA